MARNTKPSAPESVLVVGLGRFGGAVAESLVRLGHEVLGIDEDPVLVQRWANELTHVVQADSTDEEALRQVGAASFDRAVVGIGTDVEASVLTVLTLTQLGVHDVWAKAITRKHGQILERVGADHVVFPETAMGERVAHLVTGAMIDYIEFDDGYAIVKTRPPHSIYGIRLGDTHIRSTFGVTIVGVKRSGEDFTHATADTVVDGSDLIIVSGPRDMVERFSELT